jgi:hypothetical protein
VQVQNQSIKIVKLLRPVAIKRWLAA